MLEIGRVSHAHGLAVTVVKMTILPQLFRDSVWSQSRTPHLILHGNKSKHYLKIYMEQQRPQITQTNKPEQNGQCWDYHFRFQDILQFLSNKFSMLQAQKQTSQWNKIKDLNMSTHNFDHLICDKDAQKHTLENRKHR